MTSPIDRPLDTATPTIGNPTRQEIDPGADEAHHTVAVPKAGDHFISSAANDHAFYSRLEKIFGRLDAAESDDPTAYFRRRFAALANDTEAFFAALERVFGANIDRGVAAGLLLQARGGDFSWLPEVRLVGADVLGTRNGAYDQANGVIYLRRDLSQEQAAATFMEEVGHHLDHRLNMRDTIGDEGEHFRRLLLGERLTRTEIERINDQRDHGEIRVGGRTVAVEFDDPGPEEPPAPVVTPGSFIDKPTQEKFDEIAPIVRRYLKSAQLEFAASVNPQIDRTAAEVMAWVEGSEERLRELGLYDGALAMARRALAGAKTRTFEHWASGVGGIAALKVAIGEHQTNDRYLAYAQLAAATAMDGKLPTIQDLAPELRLKTLLATGALAGTGGAIMAWGTDGPGGPNPGGGLRATSTDTGSSLSDVLTALGLGGNFSGNIQGVLGSMRNAAARGAGRALGIMTVGMTVAGGAAAHAAGNLTPGQAVALGLSVAAGTTAVVLGLAVGSPAVAAAAAILAGLSAGIDIGSAIAGAAGSSDPDGEGSGPSPPGTPSDPTDPSPPSAPAPPPGAPVDPGEPTNPSGPTDPGDGTEPGPPGSPGDETPDPSPATDPGPSPAPSDDADDGGAGVADGPGDGGDDDDGDYI